MSRMNNAQVWAQRSAFSELKAYVKTLSEEHIERLFADSLGDQKSLRILLEDHSISPSMYLPDLLERGHKRFYLEELTALICWLHLKEESLCPLTENPYNTVDL